MDDVAALRAVLPGWVVWGAVLWVPVLHTAVACLVTWAVDRWNRPRLDGLHWSEKARLAYAGGRVVSLTVVIFAALGGALAHLSAGPLVPIPHLAFAFGTGAFVWLCCQLVVYRRVRWLRPEMTAALYLRGLLFLAVFFHPILYVTITMAVLGPAEPGWTFAAVHGAGVAVMVWLLFGGAVTIGRGLGLLEPGDARLRGIVAAAAAETGVRPRRVFVGNTWMANAMAFPTTGDLVFTRKAVDALDDAALSGIALHELGHVAEARLGLALRWAGLPLCIAAGMWNALVHSWTLAGFLGALLGCFVLALVAVRYARRMEHHADGHAHRHGDAAAYARALEHLHALNLSPAVLRGGLVVHPSLHDRMQAAGVTPDFPRPDPPPRLIGPRMAVGALVFLLLLGEAFGVSLAGKMAFRTEHHALFNVAITAGGVQSVYALSHHREDAAPEDAITLLRFVDARADRADVSARLASLLAERDPGEARRLLAEAERLLAVERRGQEWVRDLVRATRERLDRATDKK